MQMNRNGERKTMFVPTLVMGIIALLLFIIAWRMGDGKHLLGLKSAYKITLETLPLIILAFIVAGLIQVILPKDLLSKWVGMESGMRGIIIGTIAGGFTPGGPYVSLPIVAALVKSGASAGTLVAFLTSWSLWAVARLPMEIGILGWKFTAVRIASTFFFPPIAGIIAGIIGKFYNI